MLLEVDKLDIVAHGVPVLSEVSFTLAKGERLAVLGPASSGKSLLVRGLAGLLPPDMQANGTVRFEEAPFERTAHLGKRIAVLLHTPENAFDPLRSIGDQLGPQAAELLKEAGLDADLATRFPATLDVAQRRQVALVAALAPKPDLLIADDPVAGLDLLAQRQTVDLIQRHCTERGMALIIVTHDLKLAADLGTHVLVLSGGHAVEFGRKEDVFGHPKHDLTRRMLTAGRHRARALMRAPIGGTVIEVRQVGHKYRQPDASILEPRPPLVALEGVSFSLRAGESLALVGPAGSGKSTLLRIIAGLERATAGELEFDHQTYHGSDLPAALRREIGVIFGDPAQGFNPRLTVGESITEPLRLEALKPADELGARIVEVVNAVGLSPEMLALRPHEFSNAQLQRFAVARALLTGPRLILLDEPVAALDVVARGELLVMLNRLRADFGLTLITAGHDLEMVRIIADRVIVLDKGRVIETGTPATLLDRPQHELAQRLVAAALPEVGIVPVF